MGDESLHTIQNVQNIDEHIVTLLEKLECMKAEADTARKKMRSFKMHHEVRTLEFWRSVVSECLASFFYVFIVCGAAAGTGIGASVSAILLATSLSSGLAITALTQCFLNLSGAHINPAVTMALLTTRKVSVVRAGMYITAQCGGAIAAAALLYSVTIPTYQNNLQTIIAQSTYAATWERFGLELILTFLTVLTYLVTVCSEKKVMNYPAITIGAAYAACTFVSKPYLNPARSLGPCFVLNKWEGQWVHWLGPIMGGILSGILYEYIFNSSRQVKNKQRRVDHESISIKSSEGVCFEAEALENRNQMHSKYASGYNTYQSAASSIPTPAICEPIYGGTRSMYCRSPPLTRANLQRSQSVYAKSNGALNREQIRVNQQIAAQSLYPLRLNQPQKSSHAQNQNLQNQMQYQSESMYGNRASMHQPETQIPPVPMHREAPQMNENIKPRIQDSNGFQPIYGQSQSHTLPDQMRLEQREVPKIRHCNEDAVYGVSTRPRGPSIQSQSDDSSYGSYQGPVLTTPKHQGSNMQHEPPFMQQQNYMFDRKSNDHYSQRSQHMNGHQNKSTQKVIESSGMNQPKINQNPNGPNSTNHSSKYMMR